MQSISTLFQVRALSPLAAAVALLVASSAGQAASLGAVQNAVFFGKPFVANIPMGHLDDAPGCIETKLLYGDAPVAGTYFNVSGSTLQVRNSQAINDALVSLSVSVGCDTPNRRNYTLLPEAPVLREVAMQADEAQRRAESHIDRQGAVATKYGSTGNQNAFGVESGIADYIVVQPDPQTELRQKQEVEQRARDRARQVEERALAQAEKARADRLAQAERERQAALAAPQDDSSPRPLGLLQEPSSGEALPRLELDGGHMDWILQDPGLGGSSELLSLPNEAAREQARAAWAELAAQVPGFAEDGWDFGAGTAATTAAASGSGTASKAQQQEIDQLKKDLAQAKSSKRSSLLWSWLLFGLAGLIGLLLWRARRQQVSKEQERQSAWWQEQEGLSPNDDVRDSNYSTEPGNLGYRSKVVPQVDSLGAFVEDLPAPEINENLTADEALLEFGLSQLDPDEEHERVLAARAITESLVDLRQQADFFVALGQYEQAETLLVSYLEANPESSPLIYLDLLGIYHGAKREDRFESLREHFNSTFNANIPRYAYYGREGNGLEHYERALSRIQALWGSPQVIRVIEHSIFRRRQAEAEEAFDTLAFRDLLMLYAMALELVAEGDDLKRHQSYVRTAANWLQTAPGNLAAMEQAAAQGVPAFLNTSNGSFEAVGDAGGPASDALAQTGNVVTGDDFDLTLPDDEGLGEAATVFNEVDFEIDSPTLLDGDPSLADLDLRLDGAEQDAQAGKGQAGDGENKA